MLRLIDPRKAVFAAGVLGCMGFGGAQAFATPQPTTDVSICNDNVCTALCISRGYHYGIECALRSRAAKLRLVRRARLKE